MLKRFEDHTPEEQKVIMRDYKKAIQKSKLRLNAHMKTPMRKTSEYMFDSLFVSSPATLN